MRPSTLLLSFLSLSFVAGVSPAAAAMQQNSQSQEKEATSQTANRAEETGHAQPRAEDQPFVGNPIDRLEFRGNRVFPTEKLLSHFKYLKFNEPLPPTFREVVQAELDRLRVLLYVDSGYLQARFHEPEYEKTLNGVKITIPVEENVRYRAGKIEIVDAKRFPASELKDLIGLKKGDVIKAYSVINQAVEALKQKYGELGYAQFDVYFEPTFHAPVPDTGEAIADIEFVMEEGQAYTIGTISFAGNETFSEEFLRSKLLIKEGALYQKSLLDKSLAELNRLGSFERVIEEDIGMATNEKAKTIDLTFRLSLKQQ